MKDWNINVFGHITKRKRILPARLDGIQQTLERHHFVRLQELKNSLKKELEGVLPQKKMLWKQKSRCNWISLGDRNSKYFHVQTISRRKQNKIIMLKNGDGNWSTDEGQLRVMASTFFENLYTAEEGPILQYVVRDLFLKLTATMVA